MNADASKRLENATSELITAALRLAAYGEGCVTQGAGLRDTMKNLAADVKDKASLATAALAER